MMAIEKSRRATVHQWVAVSLPSDFRKVIDRWASTENVGHIAIMPDVHLAEDLCVGSVVASKNWIFPGAVGNDIGCGMTAVRLTGPADLLKSDCAHNLVRQEQHFGEIWWVHRKGAISASLGEAGVVPGSMGTASYHVTGRGCEVSLCSSAHGAGRALSRTEARRKISTRTLRDSMRGVWYDHRKVNALVDEAPAAYKDIAKVMRAQRNLVRVERKLLPLLNYKGV